MLHLVMFFESVSGLSMTFIKANYLVISFYLFLSLLFTGCLFESIDQPSSAQPGEIIDISIVITDNIVPEPNAHKGILGVIVPEDWEFVSGDYNSVLGNGGLILSPEWTDSLNKYYPSGEFGTDMKWITLISDKGYSYQETTSFNVQLKLQVGQAGGCFNIGYLTSKATGGLLGTGNSTWAPLSYPHQIGIPDSGLCVGLFETRPAPEWDNLFDRKSGWTGSDGIYSIPLNEYDAPSDMPADSQLILFSDTFIGEVDDNDRRQNTRMINNTLALLQSNIPDPDQIDFFWRTDSSGNPLTVFVPNTPNANPGDWYWLMDGISLNQTLYVFALRLNGTAGGFGFEVNGVVLLKFKMDDQNFISDVEQFDTPFFLKNAAENWDIVLGQAIMPMTNASGNPFPDGYIYVYGPKSKSSGKELMAARVLPEEIENFSKYEYWNGTAWGSQIEDLMKLTDGISQEFSVTPVGEEKYLLVYQTGSSVAVRLGESPTGPFGMFYIVYNCPEVLSDPNIFVYNAKAHPGLSNKEELLISYNVNTFDFWAHFSNADIYRPRFIYLKITDSTTSASNDEINYPEEFRLNQNYPNPFNPSTKISFAVPGRTNVTVKVYNPLGEMVSELVNQSFEAGQHEIQFNPTSSLSSGVYFYRIEAGEFVQTMKMILLR
jgi:hypothetical protein